MTRRMMTVVHGLQYFTKTRITPLARFFLSLQVLSVLWQTIIDCKSCVGSMCFVWQVEKPPEPKRHCHQSVEHKFDWLR